MFHPFAQRCLISSWVIGLLSMPLYGQGTESGFEDIPWGSSTELVKEKAKGSLKASSPLKYEAWNKTSNSSFYRMTLGPDSHLLQFSGRYAESTEYYFSNDRLSLVVHRPPYTQSFDAGGYVELLKRQLASIQKKPKEYIGSLTFPRGWGVYDMRSEYPFTVEWESETLLVRVACKAWPGKELREIKGVVYSSKPERQKNIKEIERIIAEKIAEQKRREEEAARKAAEAAAAAAAEAQK